MAGLKDLAIVQLVGSIYKKGKEKVVTALTESESIEDKESVKGTSETLIEKKDESEAKLKIMPEKPKEEKKVETSKAPKKSTVKKEEPGAKRLAKIALYTKDVKKHYGSVDEAFLDIVVKNLGPSIYRRDAESVSCTDPKELETVRKNFLIKKLGFNKSENDMLDNEIKKVCEIMKSSKIKYRATFYYILAKNLKKESALN